MPIPRRLRASGHTLRLSRRHRSHTPLHRGSQALRLISAGVLAVLLALMFRDWWLLLPGVFVMILLALFLALAVEPLVRAGEGLGIARALIVTVVTGLSLVLAAIVVIAILPSVHRQVNMFHESLPAILDQVLTHPWAQWLQSVLGTSVDLATLVQAGADALRDPQQLVALWGGFVSVSNGIAALAVGGALSFVLAVYFSVAMPSIRAALARSVSRSRREAVISVIDEIADGVGRFVAGQVVLAILNGMVVFVVVAMVGGPTPILFAAVATIAAFIPLVGTPIGFSIAALACAMITPAQGLIAGLALFIYMLLEAYLLVPIVMNRAVQVPSALVIIGAVVGAAIGGIAGAFFAVPVVAALVVIHRRVLVPAQERR